jgi:hypothetical protein
VDSKANVNVPKVDASKVDASNAVAGDNVAQVTDGKADGANATGDEANANDNNGLIQVMERTVEEKIVTRAVSSAFFCLLDDEMKGQVQLGSRTVNEQQWFEKLFIELDQKVKEEVLFAELMVRDKAVNAPRKDRMVTPPEDKSIPPVNVKAVLEDKCPGQVKQLALLLFEDLDVPLMPGRVVDGFVSAAELNDYATYLMLGQGLDLVDRVKWKNFRSKPVGRQIIGNREGDPDFSADGGQKFTLSDWFRFIRSPAPDNLRLSDEASKGKFDKIEQALAAGSFGYLKKGALSAGDLKDSSLPSAEEAQAKRDEMNMKGRNTDVDAGQLMNQAVKPKVNNGLNNFNTNQDTRQTYAHHQVKAPDGSQQRSYKPCYKGEVHGDTRLGTQVRYRKHDDSRVIIGTVIGYAQSEGGKLLDSLIVQPLTGGTLERPSTDFLVVDKGAYTDAFCCVPEGNGNCKHLTAV